MADQDIPRKPKRPTDHNPHSQPVDPIDHTSVRVNIFQKAVAWLDGKKTIIGAAILTTGLVMGGPWGIVLKAVGTPLATVGVVHKVGKKSKYGKPGRKPKIIMNGYLVSSVALLMVLI